MTESQIVEKNMRLVYHVLKRYRACEDYDDLVQIGSIGLVKAARSYRKNDECKFSSYACRCIWYEISKHFQGMGRQKRREEKKPISLHMTVGDKNDKYLLWLIKDRQANVETAIDTQVLKSLVEKMFKERDARIVCAYMDGYQKSEIARAFKLSNERVRQILLTSAQRLRKVGAI